MDSFDIETPKSKREVELEERIGELEAQIKLQQEMIQGLTSATPAKKGKSSGPKSELVKLIEEAVSTVAWKTVKFVNCQPEEDNLVDIVLQELKILKSTSPMKRQMERLQFAAAYSATICAKLNSTRNTVHSAMKMASIQWMKANDEKKLPPIDDILHCATRTLDPNNDDNWPTIMYYVDYLMPKFTNDARGEFTKKMRYYNPISTCKSDPNSSMVDITYETEAFGLLAIVNNHSRWPKVWELEKELKKPPGVKTRVCVTTEQKNAANKDSTFALSEEEHSELIAKYTNSYLGQTRWGGYTKEGMKLYKKYLDRIKKARESEAGQAWELRVMEKLKVVYGIKGRTWEEEQRSQGKR